MTKKEKLRILRAMRGNLEERQAMNYYPYLCWVLIDILPEPRPKLTDLGLSKPKATYDNLKWWSGNNYKSRLRCIDRAIAKLQPKKK